MQAYYLKKADENLPKLNTTVITPDVPKTVLDSGGSITIDLGNHYVGYFSFKMWFVDITLGLARFSSLTENE